MSFSNYPNTNIVSMPAEVEVKNDTGGLLSVTTNKSPKSSVILVHDGITATATSNEINMTGYNGLKVYIEMTGTGVWRLDFLGSSTSGGIFVDNSTTHYFSASRSVTIPCTSDFIKIVATECTDGSTLTVKVQGFVGEAVDNIIPKYLDLGLVVNGVNMAAGTTVYSNYFDGLQWVRNILFSSSSDQQCEIRIQRRFTDGLTDYGTVCFSSLSAVYPSYRTSFLPTTSSTSAEGNSAILGYSARFAIRNSSASANTIGNLKVQLLGQ